MFTFARADSRFGRACRVYAVAALAFAVGDAAAQQAADEAADDDAEAMAVECWGRGSAL